MSEKFEVKKQQPRVHYDNFNKHQYFPSREIKYRQLLDYNPARENQRSLCTQLRSRQQFLELGRLQSKYVIVSSCPLTPTPQCFCQLEEIGTGGYRRVSPCDDPCKAVSRPYIGRSCRIYEAVSSLCSHYDSDNSPLFSSALLLTQQWPFRATAPRGSLSPTTDAVAAVQLRFLKSAITAIKTGQCTRTITY